MSDPKVFRIPRSERVPIEFHLVYERTVPGEDGAEPTTEEVVEKFHARPVIPGTMLLDVAAGDEGQAKAIRDFLYKAIVKEDRERWIKALNDEDNVVDPAVLALITDWLMEQYGENPTESA